MTVANSILNYDNRIGDKEYLATVVTSISLPELSAIICELLRSSTFETFDITCLFLRDSMLLGFDNSACQKFIESYPESSIVKTLERLLFSTNHFIRKQVIYTLGKTCSYGSVAALSQAFNKWRDTDPLLLPSLIGEMAWLGAENLWDLVEDMTNSQIYLTRWAAIETLSNIMHETKMQDKIYQRKHKYFEKLRQDSNIFVRSYAEYEYQMLNFSIEAHQILKAERKKKRKEVIKQYQPTLSFYNLKITFENYLYNKNLIQYSIEELDEFIQNFKDSKKAIDK